VFLYVFTSLQAAKDQAKAQIEKDQSVRAMGRDPMSRGGSRRGEHRGAYGGQPGPDGWTSVAAAPPRPLPTAGDLTQFGKISKAPGGPLTFGPSSVFAKNTKETKGREASISRTNSTSNMFAMLNSEAAAEPPAPGKSSRPPSRKASADFTQTGVPEPPQRKKLTLLPRTKPVPGDAKVEEESAAPSEVSEDDGEPSLTEDQANAKIDEHLKEFWAVRNLEEADSYFPSLPGAFKARFLDKLVGSAFERKEADAKLVAEFLARAVEKEACPTSSLEEGFASQIVFMEDIAIDVPAAYRLMAILLKGSKLPMDKIEELGGKIVVEGDPAVHPKDKLLKEYEKLDSL
jgi:translation initiation factor 4G